MTTVTSVGEWRNNRWENEESTSAIVKRDTGVEIHGNDKTWRGTKAEQQGHVGAAGGAEIAHAAEEGGSLAGLHLGGAAASAAATIIGPIAGLVLGANQLVEAHEKGEAQKAAVIRDQAHVGLAIALDLPESCKQKEYAARSGTPHDDGSKAYGMAERLAKDPAGLAVVQAHCDRGVISAYAAVPMPMPEGMTVEKFLDSRPQLKQICDEDPAFRVGFEAFFKGTEAERKELLAKVEKHDRRAGNGVHIGG